MTEKGKIFFFNYPLGTVLSFSLFFLLSFLSDILSEVKETSVFAGRVLDFPPFQDDDVFMGR